MLAYISLFTGVRYIHRKLNTTLKVKCSVLLLRMREFSGSSSHIDQLSWLVLLRFSRCFRPIPKY